MTTHATGTTDGRRLLRLGLTASAALAIVSTSVLTASTVQAAPRATTSSGEQCTIVGTSGRDTLRGTNGRDVICGLGGNDRILGRGGDDVIDGGTGSDRVEGGTGNDMLLGGSGRDTVSGGSGRDLIDGGTGNDSLKGESSGDMIVGGTGNDVLYGGSGSDGLIGNSGRDRYVGSSGDDRCDFVSSQDASRSSCVGDQSAPVIVGATLDRTQIDTRSGDAQVTVSVAARDDMAAYVDFHFAGIRAESTGGTWATPSSGTNVDGVWKQTFTIPKGTPSGSYDLQVVAWDAAHAAPTTKVYRAVLTNTGASFTQPEVTSFATDAGMVVDARTGSPSATFTATIDDPQQRMDSSAELVMESVTGQTATDLDRHLTRTGGSPTSGTWTAGVTFTKGNWPSDRYDWVLRTTSKEGRTTTWVGPTLWEAKYKDTPGYRLLPGAQTFEVLGYGSANNHTPVMSSATMPGSVELGQHGGWLPWTADVSDRDNGDRLVAAVYLESVKSPGVWYGGAQEKNTFEEESNVGTVSGNVWVMPSAPRGEYRVWVLLSDRGSGQYGHHVWYGPAGAQPPTHVRTPGSTTVEAYPAGMTTTTVTVR